MDETYDVIVVGGGAAGLSGALALGRARRSVLVIDAGDPRNAPAQQVHNYLGREGTPPAELLAIGRSEVAAYGVQIEPGTAVAAARMASGFTVRLDDGREVGARRLLVTTGLTDELPDLPGVAAGWGHTVLHCPYCHGWEVRDQPLGVLGGGPSDLHRVLLFRQWTADLVYFRHTAPAPPVEEQEQLNARGITVVEGPVAGWEDGGVRMGSGELIPRRAIAVAPVFVARSAVLESLGLDTVAVEMGGQVVGFQVPVDATGLTAVAGVWAAGNVADIRAQVITSAAAGLFAGAAINADLVMEDTQLAVERYRIFDEAAWERRYSAAPAMWSGRPNAVLVAEAADLPAGRALDVGCGEGADALWLASRGWQVTGVDISTVALGRAATEAATRGLSVAWEHADLVAEPPTVGAYDLVTAHFMQLPNPERETLYAALAAAVAPGGTLLLVGHHPSDLHTTMHRPALHDMFFTADEIATLLDPAQWEIQVADTRPREAKDPHGAQLTISDAILRARRRA